MSMLSDIEANAGKKPWQVYTIKHGIETLRVAVELSKCATFETLMKRQMKNKAELLETLRRVHGEVL